MYRSALDERIAPSLARAASLESSVGLVSRTAELPQAPGEPAFSIWTGFLGDLSAPLASQNTWNHRVESGNIDGAGGAIDPDLARHIAIVESLERYSSCAWAAEDLIWDPPDWARPPSGRSAGPPARPRSSRTRTAG